MKGLAVIQARVSSSRLPGKALLPVGGLPLAVLVAKRAASTGRRVVVATSTASSDDVLVRTLEEHGIATVRGSLDDVLGRFLLATADLADDAPFFRLTADNALPDGAFLDEMEADFLASGADYMTCSADDSGLPYGMSAEITRANALREAAAKARTPYDREHVTPYIRRHREAARFRRYHALALGHFRCTIDLLEDYLSIEHIFHKAEDGAEDPVAVSWRQLVERLKEAPGQPFVRHPATRLVLGTAQLGLAYGIANKAGQPDQPTATAIVRTAITNGVGWLDTARAYGNSEAVLGRTLAGGWASRARVVTKILLSDLPEDAPRAHVEACVDAQVYQSIAALRSDRLDTLLLHRASDLGRWNGAAWERLQHHRQTGAIGQLGVSVQTPDELARALDEPAVAHIQLPLNILDPRWDAAADCIAAARERRPLVVHARSALLQGLLPSRDPTLWARAHVDRPAAIWNWLDAMTERLHRASVPDLCLAHNAALPWIDGIVIGVEQPQQLDANLRLFGRPALTADELATLRATRPTLKAETLDPARWKKAA